MEIKVNNKNTDFLGTTTIVRLKANFPIEYTIVLQKKTVLSDRKSVFFKITYLQVITWSRSLIEYMPKSYMVSVRGNL